VAVVYDSIKLLRALARSNYGLPMAIRFALIG
jgi:hypothetical protein